MVTVCVVVTPPAEKVCTTLVGWRGRLGRRGMKPDFVPAPITTLDMPTSDTVVVDALSTVVIVVTIVENRKTTVMVDSLDSIIITIILGDGC